MLRLDGYGLLPITEVPRELLDAFTCGTAGLENFLRESALSHHRDRIGLTTCVLHADHPGRLVAYFTLANDALPMKTSEITALGLNLELPGYPAVKLGRLAVSQDFQGQGVGKQVMRFVIAEVLDSESLSAARLLVTDADSKEQVVSFYKGLGFEPSLWAEDARKKSNAKGPAKTVKLFRDIVLP